MSTIDLLTPIFRNVFDDDGLIINSETNANHIDGWDSLTHIRLIVAVEIYFNIRFTTSETSELENVGEFIQLISKKLKNV